MSAVLVLVNIFLALIAIVLIVAVLMQEGNREGLGAISGGAETFFGKNKAKSVEGKLEMITKYGAAAFIILAIVSTILTARINKNNAAATAPVATPTAVEDTVTDAVEDSAEAVEENAEEAADTVEDAVEDAVEGESEDSAENNG